MIILDVMINYASFTAHFDGDAAIFGGGATFESFVDNLSSFENPLLVQTTDDGVFGNQVKRFSIKRSKAKVGDTGSQERGVIGTLTSRQVS